MISIELIASIVANAIVKSANSPPHKLSFPLGLEKTLMSESTCLRIDKQ